MMAAIRLARRNRGRTGANPCVGCLIVASSDAGARIVGAGVTAIGGRPHAETIALEEAGPSARGATAYVSLEPCAHIGGTPPCARALINAGVARVVSALTDPDARVSGQGHAMLRAGGVEVQERICEAAAAIDLEGYLSLKERGRPYVIVKLAVSTDGFVGVRGGGQVSITGAVANAQTHRLRSISDAILVGAGTIIEDDPSLTCRLPGLEERSPHRLVLDANARVPVDAKVIATASSTPTSLICAETPTGARAEALNAAGCGIIACEVEAGRVALEPLLRILGEQKISLLMVEGGREVARSFLEQRLADDLLLLVGPRAIGNDRNTGGLVRSPVQPDEVPAGFVKVGERRYGDDRALLFRRVGEE